jgi:hypothetical protein
MARFSSPPAARRANARATALTRHHPDDVDAIAEARGEAKAATLEAFIRETVDSWPPLRPEQRDRLAVLLRGAA